MTSLLTLLGLTAFGLMMRHFAALDVSSSAAYGMGLMLLLGHCAGRLARRLGLPSITGYLAMGMAAGPFALDLITRRHVADLQLINGLALSVIALTAGGEIRLNRLRRYGRTVLTILSTQTLSIVVGMMTAFALLASWFRLDFLPTTGSVWAAGLMIGIIATASSPSTTLAVIVEHGSRSATTDLILGIVMLKDIVILLLFCIGLNVAHSMSPGTSLTGHGGIGRIFTEITGSILAGLAIGAVMILFLRRVRRNQVVFILAVCFFAYEVFSPLGWHPLLIMMTAGFLVANSSREGDHLVRHLEALSPPVYVLFFTLTGAAIRLDLMRKVGIMAVFLVILRIAFKWWGTWAGIRLSRQFLHLRQNGWTAFVSQAGLSLGMATIITDQFPGWGELVAMLILASIFINQLIGPPALKWLLDRKAGDTERSG